MFIGPLLGIGITIFLVGAALLTHAFLKERGKNILSTQISAELVSKMAFVFLVIGILMMIAGFFFRFEMR